MSNAVSKKVDDYFSKYRLRKYSAGQVLLLDGDTTNYVFYLLKGKVKEYDVSYRGDEVILHVFKPFAFFPISQAIDKNSPNKFIYEAETDIEIRQAPDSEVLEFLKSNPDVMYDLLCRVYKGTDSLLGKMVQLMAGTARTRLIYELLEEARRFGVTQNDNSTLLHINEKELSARAGLSRETVSRELHKIMKDNIRINSGGITINNLDELKESLRNPY